MSNATAMMSVTAKESSTRTILALDLGKFKSVACRFDPARGEHTFETIATTPSAVHDLLVASSPSVLVMEACSVCGWIADMLSRWGSKCRWPTRGARRGSGSG